MVLFYNIYDNILMVTGNRYRNPLYFSNISLTTPLKTTTTGCLFWRYFEKSFKKVFEIYLKKF